MRHLALIALALPLLGCPSSGAPPMDMSVKPKPDMAMTVFSCCGQPGDKGNSLGVGQYCDPDPCDSTAPKKALFCATLGGDDKQHFCTFPCQASDGGDPCGENATCQCQGGQCGCVPTACLMNAPDGC